MQDNLISTLVNNTTTFNIMDSHGTFFEFYLSKIHPNGMVECFDRLSEKKHLFTVAELLEGEARMKMEQNRFLNT